MSERSMRSRPCTQLKRGMRKQRAPKTVEKKSRNRTISKKGLRMTVGKSRCARKKSRVHIEGEMH